MDSISPCVCRFKTEMFYSGGFSHFLPIHHPHHFISFCRLRHLFDLKMTQFMHVFCNIFLVFSVPQSVPFIRLPLAIPQKRRRWRWNRPYDKSEKTRRKLVGRKGAKLVPMPMRTKFSHSKIDDARTSHRCAHRISLYRLCVDFAGDELSFAMKKKTFVFLRFIYFRTENRLDSCDAWTIAEFG